MADKKGDSLEARKCGVCGTTVPSPVGAKLEDSWRAHKHSVGHQEKLRTATMTVKAVHCLECSEGIIVPAWHPKKSSGRLGRERYLRCKKCQHEQKIPTLLRPMDIPIGILWEQYPEACERRFRPRNLRKGLF